MLGTMRPVALPSYGGRQARRRLPSWLKWSCAGLVAGVAAVIYVQESWLPPRLSAREGAQLRASMHESETERARLQQALDSTSQRLDAALAERGRLAQSLDESRQGEQRLRQQLASLAATLPADPRGGAVQVRAARFKAQGGQLQYDVVLSRERASKALNGVLQLVVAGSAKKGPETSVKLPPVQASVGPVEALHGAVALPEGFVARQATVQVLDRPDGRMLGMRVLSVD